MKNELYSYQHSSGKIIAGKTIRAVVRYILSNTACSGNQNIADIIKNIGYITYDHALKCSIRGTAIIVD